MGRDAEELDQLRRRVEALEQLVASLGGRIEGLEAATGGARPDFRIADEEPTV